MQTTVSQAANRKYHHTRMSSGEDEGHEIDGQRQPAQRAIDGGSLAAHPDAANQLPHTDEQQHGREEDHHHLVGHEGDAADNDEQRDEHGG